jgi:urease
MSIGTTMLGRRHVLPSVVSTLTEIMVEGTFPVGTYLVTVHHPISSDNGDIAKALYGSFLPIPDESLFPLAEESEYESTKMPGALITVKGKVVLNKGRKRIKLKVTSKGDRPIQASSSNAKANKVLTDLDWLPLPFHRDESSARIRSH